MIESVVAWCGQGVSGGHLPSCFTSALPRAAPAWHATRPPAAKMTWTAYAPVRFPSAHRPPKLRTEAGPPAAAARPCQQPLARLLHAAPRDHGDPRTGTSRKKYEEVTSLHSSEILPPHRRSAPSMQTPQAKTLSCFDGRARHRLRFQRTLMLLNPFFERGLSEVRNPVHATCILRIKECPVTLSWVKAGLLPAFHAIQRPKVTVAKYCILRTSGFARHHALLQTCMDQGLVVNATRRKIRQALSAIMPKAI